MPKSQTPVSLSAIAEAAGVSKTTVSYVLRNTGGLTKQTRNRVLRIARDLGYKPDPRLASWMAQVREAKTKAVLPIAWLTGHRRIEVWEKYKFLSPYLEGARERALRAGYRIEIISDLEGTTPMRQLARIIYSQGIKGVIITHQSRRHIKLKWDATAAVALEGRFVAPQLHQVKTHLFHNLMLALKMTRRFGYRRIGVCLAEEVDRSSDHSVRAAILYFQSSLPREQQIVPLFFSREARENVSHDEPQVAKQVIAWVRRHRPDVVVGLHNRLENWLTSAGYHVPNEIGIVHLATDDDVSDWAGIHSRRREIGAAAVEQVLSLIQNNQYGLPATPLSTEIRGVWKMGRTLLTQKTK
jgi:LacI family transcriptional regulator